MTIPDIERACDLFETRGIVPDINQFMAGVRALLAEVEGAEAKIAESEKLGLQEIEGISEELNEVEAERDKTKEAFKKLLAAAESVVSKIAPGPFQITTAYEDLKKAIAEATSSE